MYPLSSGVPLWKPLQIAETADMGKSLSAVWRGIRAQQRLWTSLRFRLSFKAQIMWFPFSQRNWKWCFQCLETASTHPNPPPNHPQIAHATDLPALVECLWAMIFCVGILAVCTGSPSIHDSGMVFAPGWSGTYDGGLQDPPLWALDTTGLPGAASMEINNA